MKKFLFVVTVLLTVAALLVSGAAYFIQRQKINAIELELRQAQEAFDTAKYQDALTILRKVREQTDTARIAFLIGRAEYEQGRRREAMNSFAHIEKSFPTSPLVPDAMLYRARFELDQNQNLEASRQMLLAILEKHGDSTAADFALLDLAKISIKENNQAQARRNLEEIVRQAESPAREDAEFLLGDMNMARLRSLEPGPTDTIYTIARGDTLSKLQSKFRVPADLIAGINGLNPNALTIGTQIKIPRLDLSAIVDKSKRTLTLRNGTALLKKYRVGIHIREDRVPAGDYKITKRMAKGVDFTDPETGTTFRAGDPTNPLGVRALELKRDLMIHGSATGADSGRYMQKGTIALAPPDMEEVFALATTNMPVTIRGKVTPEDKVVKTSRP